MAKVKTEEIEKKLNEIINFLKNIGNEEGSSWFEKKVLQLQQNQDAQKNKDLLYAIRKSLFGMGSLTDNPTLKKEEEELNNLAKELADKIEKVIEY